MSKPSYISLSVPFILLSTMLAGIVFFMASDSAYAASTSQQSRTPRILLYFQEQNRSCVLNNNARIVTTGSTSMCPRHLFKNTATKNEASSSIPRQTRSIKYHVIKFGVPQPQRYIPQTSRYSQASQKSWDNEMFFDEDDIVFDDEDIIIGPDNIAIAVPAKTFEQSSSTRIKTSDIAQRVNRERSQHSNAQTTNLLNGNQKAQGSIQATQSTRKPSSPTTSIAGSLSGAGQQKTASVLTSRATSVSQKPDVAPQPSPQAIARPAEWIGEGALQDEIRKYNWNHSIAYKIALCESSGNVRALNYNPPREISVGLFQINTLAHTRYTHDYLYTIEGNVKAAYDVYKMSGWGAWKMCYAKIQRA